MLLALDFEVASDILKAVLLPTEIDLTILCRCSRNKNNTKVVIVKRGSYTLEK